MAEKEIKAEDKPKEEVTRTPEPSVLEIEQELFRTDSGTRVARERVWYRNILYYMGEQWIEWSKTKKRFEPTWQYEGQSDPQPVANIILDYVRAIKALYLNKDVEYNVWPNSNDHEDKQAAELGGKVLDDMDKKDSGAIIDEVEAMLVWMVLTGTGFIRDFPDMGLGQWIGNTGKKTGDVATEAVMPFNVYVGDTAGINLRKKPMVGIQSLKDKTWVEDTFPSYKPGTSSDVQQGHDYQRSLQQMVGTVSEWKSAGVDNLLQGSGLGANGRTTQDKMLLFREIEIAPTVKHPQGRYIVRVGGQTLVDVERMPIPVSKDGTWRYTLEDIRHNLIPGSFWGEPGTNSLISPQNTINKIDQALVKNREDVAKPTVTTPIGSKFKTKSHRGSSVKVIEYDPITAGGTAPTVTHGKALPTQILDERNVQMSVSRDSGGDPNQVLRGSAPSGASGVMVDIMKESAEAGHGPDIGRIARGLQRSASKRLIIAQELFTEERILKISGVEGKISIKKFKGADLRSNHDVRLEVTTGFSSTNAGKVATVSGLIQSGLFNEQITERKTRNAVTTMMGLKGFDDEISPDEARAERENTLLANGEADKVYIEIPVTDEGGIMMEDPNNPGQPLVISPVNDPLFEVDNHQVHYEVWRQFVISPQFMDLSEEDKTIAMAHGHAHKKRMDIANMEAQAAMMEQQEGVVQ